MTEPIHDDERLSALLAGRLEGPERDELLAYLSTADEDRDVFANTAAILREMEEEDAQREQSGVQVADPPQRRWLPPSFTEKKRDRSSRPLRWAVPTVLAGLAVSVYLATRPGPVPAPVAGPGPVAYAMALEYPAEGMPAGWSTDVPGASRGGDEPAEQTSENAAKAGMFLVRLAVAVQVQDAAETERLATQVRKRFDPNGRKTLPEVQERAGEPAESLMPLLQEAENRIEAQFDSSFVGLGGWTEAARMAAAEHNAGFFHSADARARLERAATLTAGDELAQAALARVQTLLDAGGTPNWEALATELSTLLNEIAS